MTTSLYRLCAHVIKNSNLLINSYGFLRFCRQYPLINYLDHYVGYKIRCEEDDDDSQEEDSRKISEFQAEGLGFRNFAWLGSNPSDAPGGEGVKEL